MEVVSKYDVLSTVCRVKRKWGLYASWCIDDLDEVRKAAPYLSSLKEFVIYNGEVYLFFGSEAEMQDIYDQTVGEDGPTRLNGYDGPGKVFALTCGPDGELRTENT